MKKNILMNLLGALLLMQWAAVASISLDVGEILLVPHIYKWFLGPQKKEITAITSRVFPLLYYACLNKQIKNNTQLDAGALCTSEEELVPSDYFGTRTATSFVMKASSTAGAITFEPLTYNISLSAASAGTVSFDPGSGTISLNQSVATTSAPSFTGATLSNQGQLKFYEATGGGTNYAAIQAPAALGVDYTLTLPTTAGTNGYALTTNGSGVLSWSPFAAGSYFANGGNAFGVASAILGTTDAFGLRIQTEGVDRITIANTAGSGIVTVPSAVYADGGIDVTATGGTDTLNIGTTNAEVINLGTATTTQTINIGTGSGVTTINIGGAGDTVNVGGTLTWVKTTDLEVTDKLITINKGGAAASGGGSGIQVEEDVTGTPTITGYVKTSSDRKSWQLVAPAQASIVTLAPIGANFTISSPATGTFFSGSGTVNVAASGTNNTGIGASAGALISSGTSNTGVGSGALSAVTTGTDNTAIGRNAGSGYTSSESNNICIGSGVSGTASETQTTRLGVAAQTACYIGGVNVSNGATALNVVGIDTNNKLATSTTGGFSLNGNLSTTGNVHMMTRKTLTMNTSDDVSAITDSGIIYTNKYAAGMPSVSSFDRINLAFNYYDITNPSTPVIPNSGYGTSLITLGGDTTAGAGGAIVLGTSATNNTGPTARMAIRNTGTVEFYKNINLDATTVITEGTTPYIHHSGPTSPVTNIFVGDNAGNLTLTGGNNTGCGVGALLSLAAVSGGAGNTGCGRAALQSTTTGNSNTAVGLNAMLTNTIGNYNAAVGLSAMYYNLSGTNNVAVGDAALYTNSTGSANTALGAGALLNTTVSNQTAVGFYALNLASTGTGNTAVGYYALQSCTTGTNNSALGYSTLTSCTGSENTAVGSNALDAAVTGSYNTAFGYNALTNFVPTVGGENTAIGHRSGEALTSGVQNIFVGGASGLLTTTGARNTCVGYLAGGNADIGSDNTGVGNKALYVATAGQLTAVGSYALDANTTGTGNTAVGYNALTTNVTNADNTAVGHSAGAASTTLGGTFVGRSAGVSVSSGGNNTFIGAYAGATTVTGFHNVALGYSALGQATSSYSASYNTAIGNYALRLNQYGSGNTAVGHLSLNALTGGAFNVALGNNAGNLLTTGSNNILVGYLAGNAYTSSETNNVIIGDQNVGVVGESNIIRIQGAAAHDACYIDGIWTKSSDSGQIVYCNSSHKIGAPASSIRFKENIQEIPANKRASDLHPVSFNYKDSETKELWYGLIAEEVEEILPELVIKDSGHLPMGVKYQHVPILLLKEVKELRAVIADLQARIAALEARL